MKILFIYDTLKDAENQALQDYRAYVRNNKLNDIYCKSTYESYIVSCINFGEKCEMIYSSSPIVSQWRGRLFDNVFDYTTMGLSKEFLAPLIRKFIDEPLTVEKIEDYEEGKFDYDVIYTTKGCEIEMRRCKRVHKSELADTIEDAFEWGAYDMEISCVERKK